MWRVLRHSLCRRNPEDFIEVSHTQESSLQINGESIQEGKSIQEITLQAHDSTHESIQETRSIEESIQEIKSNRDKVLYILSRKSSMTLDEVAKIIGLLRIGVQKIASKLQAEGILSRKGSTKAGEWVVKEGI